MGIRYAPFSYFAAKKLKESVARKYFEKLKSNKRNITEEVFDSFIHYWRYHLLPSPASVEDFTGFMEKEEKKGSKASEPREKIVPQKANKPICPPFDTDKLPRQEVRPLIPSGWICVKRTSSKKGSEAKYDVKDVLEHRGPDNLVLTLHEDEYIDIRFHEENALNHWRPQNSEDRTIYNSLRTPSQKQKLKRTLLRRQFPIRAVVTAGMRYTRDGRIIDPRNQVVQLYQLVNPDQTRIRKPRTLGQVLKRKKQSKTKVKSVKRKKKSSFIISECSETSGNQDEDDEEESGGDGDSDNVSNPFASSTFKGCSGDVDNVKVKTKEKVQPKNPFQFFNSSDDEDFAQIDLGIEQEKDDSNAFDSSGDAELGKIDMDAVHISEVKDKHNEDNTPVAFDQSSHSSNCSEEDLDDNEQQEEVDDEEESETEEGLSSDRENDVSSFSEETSKEVVSASPVADKTGENEGTNSSQVGNLSGISEDLMMQELGESDYNVKVDSLHDSFLSKIDPISDPNSSVEILGEANIVRQGKQLNSDAKRTFFTLQNDIRGSIVTSSHEVFWKSMINYNDGGMRYLPSVETKYRKVKFTPKDYKAFGLQVKDLVSKKYVGQEHIGHLKLVCPSQEKLSLVDLNVMSYIDIHQSEIFPLIQCLMFTHFEFVKKDIMQTFFKKRDQINDEVAILKGQLEEKRERMSELEWMSHSSRVPFEISLEISDLKRMIQNHEKDIEDLTKEMKDQIKYIDDHNE